MQILRYIVCMMLFSLSAVAQQEIRIEGIDLKIDGSQVELSVPTIDRFDLVRTVEITRQPDELLVTGYNNKSTVSVQSKGTHSRWTKLRGRYIMRVTITSKISREITVKEEAFNVM